MKNIKLKKVTDQKSFRTLDNIQLLMHRQFLNKYRKYSLNVDALLF